MNDLLDENLEPLHCLRCKEKLTLTNIGEPVFGVICKLCMAVVNAGFRRMRMTNESNEERGD